jgi:regulator of RNase E activity RraA
MTAPATIGHYTEFGFMDPGIKPLNPKCKVVGPAFTVRTPPQDSTAVHLAMGRVSQGDVVVIDRSLDRTHACVGEMVALAAKMKRVAAIIVDGPVTDMEEILEMDLPVFCRGRSSLTTKLLETGGEINLDISCGGVVVRPGDIVMGDCNGVLVLRPFEAEELVRVALQDQEDEMEFRRKLREGALLPYLSGLE